MGLRVRYGKCVLLLAHADPTPKDGQVVEHRGELLRHPPGTRVLLHGARGTGRLGLGHHPALPARICRAEAHKREGEPKVARRWPFELQDAVDLESVLVVTFAV